MDKADETDPQAAFAQSMAFNTEAVRSGLFASAQDIAKVMQDADVPHGEACLLTGAVEMAAQLWMQVMLKAGKSRMEARKALEKQVRTFAIKHSQTEHEQPVNPS